MPKASRRPPAQAAMLQLITGYWVSQLVYTAVRLGIADVLAKTPRTPDAIAKQVGAHAPFVHRLLRALASVGVFAETAGGRFKLTPMGATLRTGVPGSLADFAHMAIDDYNWTAWGGLLDGVTTGERPFDRIYGEPLFGWMRKQPEKEAVFAKSMASISSSENAAIARAYEFGKFRQLVDVGGAHGHLLATILRRHRRLRGILYDQPQVVAGAERSGFLKGLETRCEVVGGDFFSSVPAGADLYMMKYIIHDWDDDLSVRILTNCRNALAPGGRVLVIDHVVAPGNGADFAKLLDINMMVLPGGKERTKPEFEALLGRAGLSLKRIVRTAAPICIVEAVAAA